MKLIAVHTVPVWQDETGELTYGLYENSDHPPVIGWANVLEVKAEGETFHLLALDEVKDGDGD